MGMRYKVVDSVKKSSLEYEVNEYIKKGWHLIGGVSVAVDESGCIYAQAMAAKYNEAGERC